MISRLTALTSTALAVLMAASPAFADNNNVYLDQDGTDNIADVEQTGDNNSLGTPLIQRRALQDGDFNTLILDQSSTLGHNGNIQGANFGTNYLGLNQTGDYNRIEATQQSGTVEQIQQNSSAAGGTVSGTTNLFVLDQKYSSSNKIQYVWQTFTGTWISGSENSIDSRQSTPTGLQTGSKITTLSQTGQYNTIETDQQTGSTNIGEINQNGVNNLADTVQAGTGNIITLIDQDGDDNEAFVTQTGGTGNKVGLILQNSTGGAPAFVGNYANVIMTGTGNGAGLLMGYSVIGRVTSSQITQLGGNNDASLEFTGDGNDFGVYQTGTDNSVGSILVTGDDNLIGVDQDGTGNILALGVIEGDRNNVGVLQAGIGNLATVSILGGASDDNGVRVQQDGTNNATVTVTGSMNDVRLNQGLLLGAGGTNLATVSIVGDDNVLDILQQGDNEGLFGVSVTIDGSGNNSAGAGAFASLFGGALTASGLSAGQIVQQGTDNLINIKVGNLSPSSDNNLFAFKQTGDGNTVNGTINGDGNQALVFQSGDSNTTNFTQTGGNNYVVVTQ